MRQHRRIRALLALLVVAAAAALVAGCGGGNSSSSQGIATDVDRAFVRLMVPHHQSAIDMAKTAKAKATHREIKKLAINITSTQTAEIGQMTEIAKTIGTDVGGSGSSMSGMDHGGGHSMGDAGDLKTLGLTQDAAGMSMDMAMLENAKPFDRTFIDMMVPHHEGAVRMAKAELAKGQNPDLKALAKGIVDAQNKEIKEMNAWRTKWYGAPVPSSS